MNKLARVKVDIPNSLDNLWDIDIKKSTAKLPDIIKEQLYTAIKESVFRSEYVIRNTGNKTRKDNIVTIWERKQREDGSVSYHINRDLPQIKLLESEYGNTILKPIDILLKTIENAFPAREAYLDVADGQVEEKTLDALIDDFNQTLIYAKNIDYPEKMLIETLLKSEPYVNYKNFEEEWRKKHEQ